LDIFASKGDELRMTTCRELHLPPEGLGMASACRAFFYFRNIAPITGIMSKP